MLFILKTSISFVLTLKGKILPLKNSFLTKFRYSGADINILIRDACYGPLRKAQVATHFKPVDTLEDGKLVYQPCDPSDPDAQQMKMLDIPGPQLKPKIVSIVRFLSI